jgi:hypothetical protein
MHNLPTLAKGPFRCTALVHPIDAERLNLKDGAIRCRGMRCWVAWQLLCRLSQKPPEI